MIEVIFISGVNYLNFSKEGTYSFALAHLVKQNPEYVKCFQNNKEQKCIYDNGCAELGKSIDINDVLKGARKVDAWEIWCPDKLYDKKETLKMTKEFIRNLQPTDKFQLCGVPQGKNFKEWLECYIRMINNSKIDVIALSKYSCPRAFKQHAGTELVGKARPVAVEWLHEHNLITKPLHLAGADNFIIEEIKKMKQYPMVRSIDSNIAFKLGVHRIKIDECDKEPEERLNHDIKDLDKEQLEIISYNIKKIKEAQND